MRRQLGALVIGACMLQPVALDAQESAGRLRSKLTEALDATARGQCLDSVLGPLVLDACEQQIGRLQPALSRLGPIKTVRFRGIEQFPNGTEVEVYRVVFASGEMTWMIAAGPNGKLTVLYSQG